MNSKPGRGSDQFPLRLPDGMRDRIKLAADKSGRSMNAEIVDRIEETFALDDSLPYDLTYADVRAQVQIGSDLIEELKTRANEDLERSILMREKEEAEERAEKERQESVSHWEQQKREFEIYLERLEAAEERITKSLDKMESMKKW